MPMQFPTFIELSSLDGKNGFMMAGVTAEQGSGWSVSSAGDVNDDGNEDLIVGAPFASISNQTSSGQSYVVFGGTFLSDTGIIQLSCLNGTNGFVLDGVAANDQSGYSVALAGDVNNDGVDDLIVGAYQASPSEHFSGQSYVIFGSSSVGSVGAVHLADLNGINGFKINGIAAKDYSGFSVASAGDVNADGISDIIIGAYHASPNGLYSGQSYVVFGGPSIGHTGTLLLSNLDGSNGFKLDGISAGDYSGISVASIGDFNADGVSDLVIGASGTDTNGVNAGQSYVIFGSSNVGSSGTIQLSDFQGNLGFKINGIAAGDHSGNAVASAGDVNADGVVDVIIGAYHANPNGRFSGQSYVIFGGASVGSSGTLELSNLNGQNGFKIDGISTGDYDGFFVASTSDINGDGVADVIVGAPYASVNEVHVGQSYVIFGSPDVGSLGTIQLASLDGANGFAVNGIAAQDVVGWSVACAGDLNADGLRDVVVGAPYANANNLLNAGKSYVIFGDTIELGNNQLSLFQGETVILTAKNLNATSKIHPANTLQFQVSALQHGRFSFVTTPHVPINQFYQQNITAAEVRFSHDGSIYPPRYNISALTGMWASTLPAAADVSFAPLRLTKNELIISQGRTALVTTNNIFAFDTPSIMDDAIIFTVKNATHGQFENVAQIGLAINVFSQAEILKNQIQFVPDGSIDSPHYLINVADSIYTLPFFDSNITFFSAPVILVNELTINQGQSVILNQNNLRATDVHTPVGEIIFSVSAIKSGHFELLNNLGVIVTNFTQQLVDLKVVQFIQDGSTIVPSYNVSAIGKTGAISEPLAVAVTWVSKAPRKIDKTGRNILIGMLSGAAVLGALVISYVALGYSKNYQIEKIFRKINGEDKRYYEESIIPIAREIFGHIKITGLMNFVSHEKMNAYITAIAEMVEKIRQLGVNVEFKQMEPAQRVRLLTGIIRQMKHHLEIEKNKFECIKMFFKPRVTPEMISAKAQVIAEGVRTLILNKSDAVVVNIPTDFDLSYVVGQSPDEASFTTNYVRMP